MSYILEWKRRDRETEKEQMKTKKEIIPCLLIWEKEDNSGKLLYFSPSLEHQNGIGFSIQVGGWFFSTCNPNPKSAGNFYLLPLSGTDYHDPVMKNLSYAAAQQALHKRAASYLLSWLIHTGLWTVFSSKYGRQATVIMQKCISTKSKEVSMEFRMEGILDPRRL